MRPFGVLVVIGGSRNRLPQQRTEAGVNVVSVSQNDGQTSYCRCDKCARLAEHEGSQSGPIIHFVNQVADDIKDDYPGLFIETLAYGYTHSPPRDVKARDNVLVRLCSGGGYFKVIAPGGGFHLRYHPFSDGTSANDDLIVKWSKVSKNLHAWYYDLDDEHYLLPRPNLYSIQPNIKFYVDHNVTGIFVQGVGGSGGEFAELRSYLLARALWNADSDWEADLNEFLAAYYGAAAEPLRRYIELVHQWPSASAAPLLLRGNPRNSKRFYITREFVQLGDPLFDKAEAAVADDPVRLLRVRKERLGLTYVKLCSEPHRFFATWQEHSVAVDRFAAIAQRYDIIQAGEGRRRKVAPRLETWRKEVQARRQADQLE